MSAVHPTALVERGASLGRGVSVGAYTTIGADVKIGAGTRIGSHVVLEGPLEIGRDCVVRHHASVGTEPQDLTYEPGTPTRTFVGDRTTIGNYANVTRGTLKDREETTIGSDCYLMAYAHVGHDAVVEDNVIITNGSHLGGHVFVGDGAYLSALVTVSQFCRIGSRAILSGGAQVNQDIPPFSMAGGWPAKLIGVNRVGLQRAGFDKAETRAVREAFRFLFLCERPFLTAVEEAREKWGAEPRVQHLLEFIDGSKKGVARQRRSRRDRQADE